MVTGTPTESRTSTGTRCHPARSGDRSSLRASPGRAPRRAHRVSCAGLSPGTAGFAEQVRNAPVTGFRISRRGQALPYAPTDIESGQIAHRAGSHREPERFQRQRRWPTPPRFCADAAPIAERSLTRPAPLGAVMFHPQHLRARQKNAPATTTDKIFPAVCDRASAVPRSISYVRVHTSRHRYPSHAGLHAKTSCFRIFLFGGSTAGSVAIALLRLQPGTGT